MARQQTILLVDDDRAIRKLCRMVLEKSGFTVLEAEDGEQAIAIIFSVGPIALLITDVEMPRLSGPALVQAVRQQAGGIKVLYISGWTRDNRLLQRHVLESGCGFLQKPFTPEDLVARVRSLLDSLAEPAAG